VTLANELYARIPTCQVPEDGDASVQVSLLPYRYGRQSYDDVVGSTL
jgi:hypothetical protein